MPATVSWVRQLQQERRKQIWSVAAIWVVGDVVGSGDPPPGKNWKLKLKCLLLGTFQGILNYMHNVMYIYTVHAYHLRARHVHVHDIIALY